ncbi:MAG: GNAT family N-acetyltransferase [Phycisphaerales bacterium]|nr:GNAT family N-acetyltransferase [Phycisphaerales bacterium]
MNDPRPFRDEDLPGVLDLIGRCYAEYGLVLDLDDECEAHLHDLGGTFRPDGEYWVIDDGGVIATVALRMHEGIGELKSLYVDPGRRRTGLGARLTRLVIDEARARGASTLELWSDTRFEAAHALYRSLGFEAGGTRHLHDSNDSWELAFRLDLDGASN